MKTQNKAGFTLVEIMIVVAIIALLAAIAVPNFLRARVRSQATTMVNDVRMIESAAEQYAIENGLAGTDTVNFNSLVSSSYFKSGSKIASGQSGVALTASETFGVLYSSIPTTTKLTVLDALRLKFSPTVSTVDRLWEN